MAPALTYRRRAFPWREPPHPFAQRRLPSTDGATTFRSPVAGALYALVADHVVQGRVIFPGAGYVEMTRAAAGGAALRGVFFLQPLAVEAAGQLVECVVRDGRFDVRSGMGDELADATVHCSGVVAPLGAWRRVEHASLRARRCARAASIGALYDGFDAVGLQYGPGYRTLERGWGGASEAVARLRARPAGAATAVHPADLDDALCTAALMRASGANGETRLPFALDEALLQGAPGMLWAVRDLATLCVQLWSLVWLSAAYVCVRAGGGAGGRRGGGGTARGVGRPATGAAHWLQVACAAGAASNASGASPVCDRVVRRRCGGGYEEDAARDWQLPRHAASIRRC